MLFHSTRGKDKDKTFKEVLMQGLASDGGLFMPDYWPAVDLEHLKNCNTFIDVAKHIVPLFTDSSFDRNDVEDMLDNTWHDFAEKNLLKIVEILKSSRKNQIIANTLPSCRIADTEDSGSLKPNNKDIIFRCPVLLIGINSVIP